MNDCAKKKMKGRKKATIAGIGTGFRRFAQMVGDEAKANFAAWYERNFKNARAGRIGQTSYVRAGALDDHLGDGAWYADAHARATLDYVEPLSTEEARIRSSRCSWRRASPTCAGCAVCGAVSPRA